MKSSALPSDLIKTTLGKDSTLNLLHKSVLEAETSPNAMRFSYSTERDLNSGGVADFLENNITFGVFLLSRKKLG
jgi:hypothetical protein